MTLPCFCPRNLCSAALALGANDTLSASALIVGISNAVLKLVHVLNCLTLVIWCFIVLCRINSLDNDEVCCTFATSCPPFLCCLFSTQYSTPNFVSEKVPWGKQKAFHVYFSFNKKMPWIIFQPRFCTCTWMATRSMVRKVSRKWLDGISCAEDEDRRIWEWEVHLELQHVYTCHWRGELHLVIL